jgi:hypothetical protein
MDYGVFDDLEDRDSAEEVSLSRVGDLWRVSSSDDKGNQFNDYFLSQEEALDKFNEVRIKKARS